ncbi:MAG: PIN domain-containing protein [Desulfobacteraceae bacterium]|nr:MAG: PIN domain-containing protein [Desulfobacteraceae bacterium]
MTAPKNLVIDANIILRVILNDIPEQTDKVYTLLQKAKAGKMNLLIPEPVLSDVIYVLSGLKVPKQKIAETVRDWLNLPGMATLGIDRNIIYTSLDLFVDKNIKWSDALIAARMLEWGYTDLCTFDRHFERIEGITVVNP